MEFKIDTGTGYMYCYNPSHPVANAAGKVMEHVLVITNQVGRMLRPDECVHHKDRDKTNNALSNLQLMTNSDHAKLHAEEDHGVVFVDRSCLSCKTLFQTTSSSARKYCSSPCSSKGLERFSIPIEDLKMLVWKEPTTSIAERLGVSDVAIAKRCKKYGISKPGRGYWSKQTMSPLGSTPDDNP